MITEVTQQIKIHTVNSYLIFINTIISDGWGHEVVALQTLDRVLVNWSVQI